MAKTKRTTKSASTSRSAKRTTKRTNATRSEPTKKKNTKQYLQLMTIDDSKYIGFYCGFSIRKSSICIISRNKEANHDKTLLENIAWCIQNMSCVPQFIDAKHIEANMLSKHKFAWSDGKMYYEWWGHSPHSSRHKMQPVGLYRLTNSKLAFHRGYEFFDIH
eukprot:144424_1